MTKARNLRLGTCYVMVWEGVSILVRIEVRNGVVVAVPPSGHAFPVTACPGAVWRQR